VRYRQQPHPRQQQQAQQQQQQQQQQRLTNSRIEAGTAITMAKSKGK
jgi:hypothetical protein